MTLVFTAVLLAAVTLLASYIPSRRAAGANPIAALRYD
jgi:ABC-type lipoprotein release transport system permease subunit